MYQEQRNNLLEMCLYLFSIEEVVFSFIVGFVVGIFVTTFSVIGVSTIVEEDIISLVFGKETLLCDTNTAFNLSFDLCSINK